MDRLVKQQAKKVQLFSLLSEFSIYLASDVQEMGLLSPDQILSILRERISYEGGVESKEYKNAENFFSLSQSQLRPGVPDIASVKAFLHFIIFEHLKEECNFRANYFLECAYNCDSQRKNPQNSRLYYYARAIEERVMAGYSPKEIILQIYSDIIRAAKAYRSKILDSTKVDIGFSKEAQLSLIKMTMIQGRSFAEIIQLLNDLQEKYPDLGEVIEIEKAWIVLCDHAKSFKSEDPNLRELLQYLQDKVAAEFPNIRDQTDAEAHGAAAAASQGLLREISDGEKIMLIRIMQVAEDARNRLLSRLVPTDILSRDKITQAFLILYGNLSKENPNYSDLITYYNKGLANSDPYALYEFYKHYKEFREIPDFTEFFKQYSKDSVLELAAWAGNADAQYEAYCKFSGKIISPQQEESAAAASAADDAAQSRAQLKLQALGNHFLMLAANQGHVDALFELGLAIETKKIACDNEYFYLLYYKKAASLGHYGALEKYHGFINRVMEIDIAAISEEDLLFLQSMARHSDYASLRYAACLHEGRVEFRNLVEAKEILQDLITSVGGNIKTQEDLDFLWAAKARLAFILSELKEKDRHIFVIDILQDERLLQKVQQNLASENIFPQERFKFADLILNALKSLNKGERLRLGPLFDHVKEMIRVTIEDLASKFEFAPAKLSIALSLFEESDFVIRQKSLTLFLELLPNIDDGFSDGDKKLILEKISSLCKNHDILSPDTNIVMLNLLLTLDFDSKAQFQIYHCISALIAKKDDPIEKVALEKLSFDLLLRSADSYPPSLEECVNLCFAGEIFDEEKISKLKELLAGKKISLPTLVKQIYLIAKKSSEDKLPRLKEEAKYFYSIAIEREQNQIKKSCSTWAKDFDKSAKVAKPVDAELQALPVSAAIEKSPAVGEQKDSAVANIVAKSSASEPPKDKNKQNPPTAKKNAAQKKCQADEDAARKAAADAARKADEDAAQKKRQADEDAARKAAADAANAFAEEQRRKREEQEKEVFEKHQAANAAKEQARQRREQERQKQEEERQKREEQERQQQEEQAKFQFKKDGYDKIVKSMKPIQKFCAQTSLPQNPTTLRVDWKGSSLYLNYFPESLGRSIQDIDLEVVVDPSFFQETNGSNLSLPRVLDEILRKIFPNLKKMQKLGRNDIRSIKIWRGAEGFEDNTAFPIHSVEFTIDQKITGLNHKLNIIIRNSKNLTPQQKDWVASFDALRVNLYNKEKETRPELSVCEGSPRNVDEVLEEIRNSRITLNPNNFSERRVKKYQALGLITQEQIDSQRPKEHSAAASPSGSQTMSPSAEAFCKENTSRGQ